MVQAIVETHHMNQGIFRYLDTVGDGSGTKDAVGNYSDAGLGQTDFILQPPVGSVFMLTRLLWSLADSGAMNSGGFGSGSALTNGIEIFKIQDATTVLDVTDGLPIKTNGDWVRLCYDLDLHDFGPGNNYLSARFTFLKSGAIISLSGNNLEKLVVRLHDDMSGLAGQFFNVQGHTAKVQL